MYGRATIPYITVANPLSQKGSVGIAIGIAIVLIGGAYYLSGYPFPRASSADAASTEQLLKEYAVKDSDGDGMPDWEEALYCTDPNNAHSVRADLTDAQAVAQGLKTPCYAWQGNAAAATSTNSDIAGRIPTAAPAANSLTDRFARLFFDNYMSSRGTMPPTAQEMQQFVQDAVANLAQTNIRTDAYAASDMRVAGSGADALRTYAAGVEKTMAANDPRLPYSELTYFSDAEQKNDAQAIKNIGLIAKGYADTAAALAKVAVPSEAAQQHLALVNAMARLSSTIGDMGTVQSDPIRAMLGLEQYKKDGEALADALAGMGSVFATDDASLSKNQDGYRFYALITSTQAATQTP